jgi:heme oxygenase (biliverdin-IX-beta and delta-forming)
MSNHAPQTPEKPPLITALRLATAPIHEAVERLPGMERMMGPTVTSADYHGFLIRLARLYGSLEPACYAALEVAGTPPDGRPTAGLAATLGLRPKYPCIRADLEANGLAPPPLDLPLASAPDLATALGALYVLEGSSLGGRVIARHLRRHLGDPLPGEHFFQFHADQAATDWKTFGGALQDLAAAGRINPEAVITAACAVFQTIYETLATLDREDNDT